MFRILAFMQISVLWIVSPLLIAQSLPTSPITSLQIISYAISGIPLYSQWKPIGLCYWLDGYYLVTTKELFYYSPDFIVSSYNNALSNPWVEGKTADKIAYTNGNTAINSALASVVGTGLNMTDGKVSLSTQNTQQGIAENTKVVDVVGMLKLGASASLFQLNSDTTPMMPYYYSYLDIGGRLGTAELLKPETYGFIAYFIGQSPFSKWGNEYPRNMINYTTSGYRAAAMNAQKAADIVTNISPMHSVIPVTDSCGINCSISNVIEEQIPLHEQWQMVSPLNMPIYMGAPAIPAAGASIGAKYDALGGGNYVFIVWRKHMGCVQSAGTFLGATVIVPPTIRR